MLKEIRQYYGIDQQLFADYLGISRSQLSMAEGGSRNIAPQSISHLLPLYKAIGLPVVEQDEKVLEELAAQRGNLEKKIKIKSRQHQHRLFLLRGQLIAMKAGQERSLQILSIISNLAKEASGNDANLMKIIELNARKLQRKTGQQHQWKLELKILHLQTEITFFKKLAIEG